MQDLKWLDITKEQPAERQAIFYLDTKTSGYYEGNRYLVGLDDIDKGEYIGGNLVEWHFDNPCDEFKYWFPVPRYIK